MRVMSSTLGGTNLPSSSHGRHLSNQVSTSPRTKPVCGPATTRKCQSLTTVPACFENVTPVKKKNQLFILDKNNHELEVLNQNVWKLLAMSSGYPIKIFGEWTGDIFIPLSAESEGRLVAL